VQKYIIIKLLMQATGRKVMRVSSELAVFLECDVQQKMVNHIKGFDAVATNCARMAQASKVLGIPLIATK
jgi:hypothetical protein